MTPTLLFPPVARTKPPDLTVMAPAVAAFVPAPARS
jgi:hypothetical protein